MLTPRRQGDTGGNVHQEVRGGDGEEAHRDAIIRSGGEGGGPPPQRICAGGGKEIMAHKNGLLIPMLRQNIYFGAQEVAGKQPIFPATSRMVK